MTITRLYHVRMTTAMVRTRTKVVETTGSQVVITEAGKEMTVLTIINNLRKIAQVYSSPTICKKTMSLGDRMTEKRVGTTPMVSKTTETTTGITKASCGVALYNLL